MEKNKQKVFTPPMEELLMGVDPIKDFIYSVDEEADKQIEEDPSKEELPYDPFTWDKEWLKSIKVEYLGRYSFERMYFRHPKNGLEKPYMTRITVEVRLPQYVNEWSMTRKTQFSDQCAMILQGDYIYGEVVQIHADIKTNRLVKKSNKEGVRKAKYPFIMLEITYNNEEGLRNSYSLKELCKISNKAKKLFEGLAQSFLDKR